MVEKLAALTLTVASFPMLAEGAPTPVRPLTIWKNELPVALTSPLATKVTLAEPPIDPDGL